MPRFLSVQEREMIRDLQAVRFVDAGDRQRAGPFAFNDQPRAGPQ